MIKTFFCTVVKTAFLVSTESFSEKQCLKKFKLSDIFWDFQQKNSAELWQFYPICPKQSFGEKLKSDRTLMSIFRLWGTNVPANALKTDDFLSRISLPGQIRSFSQFLNEIIFAKLSKPHSTCSRKDLWNFFCGNFSLKLWFSLSASRELSRLWGEKFVQQCCQNYFIRIQTNTFMKRILKRSTFFELRKKITIWVQISWLGCQTAIHLTGKSFSMKMNFFSRFGGDGREKIQALSKKFCIFIRIAFYVSRKTFMEKKLFEKLWETSNFCCIFQLKVSRQRA